MAIETITKQGVLIIDPQPNMAMLVATMLRSLGRRDIREANDAGQAMLELRRRIFDVIVLDDGIAGSDAVDLVRRIRGDHNCQNRLVPIIMMAAAPDAARIAAARDAGVTEFLRKPFAANHLKSRLDHIEANPRGFVDAGSYAGPDRRRRKLDIGAADRRGR
ncbi:response regulator [Devosia sp. YIM 151766]|uniref:response regulator n=1 Tax=Devosia sp. YIM 151766 TaxID=3017325 RepID=UPI00255CB0D8|nr:response regulator [Devosia sp. YIM 151766]WIY52325.1 response regulator [Devosia sp. YIM 151766]